MRLFPFKQGKNRSCNRGHPIIPLSDKNLKNLIKNNIYQL